MVTLDTNAVIYYLNGDESVCLRINEELGRGMPLYVSSITVAELLRFPKLTDAEERSIRTFLSICSVINVDAIIAEQSGLIGRMYNLKLADSIIAATALFTGSTLLTRNTRDFKRVPTLAVKLI